MRADAFEHRRSSSTYVVETGTDGNSEGDDGTDGTTDGGRIVGLDAQVGVSDTSGEESSVGGMDERSGSTVELSKEDEEESEGSRLGEVAVGTNGAVELGELGRGVGLLAAGTVNNLGITRAEIDVRVEAVGGDVGGEVGVVTGEEGRVRQGGLWVRE